MTGRSATGMAGGADMVAMAAGMIAMSGGRLAKRPASSTVSLAPEPGCRSRNRTILAYLQWQHLTLPFDFLLPGVNTPGKSVYRRTLGMHRPPHSRSAQVVQAGDGLL